MSDINYELELFKLITEEKYVDEFGWISDGSFCIWVDYFCIHEFMKRFKMIFGEGIFDDGGFDGNMQRDCVCIAIDEALEGYDIDLESIFPKDKYEH